MRGFWIRWLLRSAVGFTAAFLVVQRWPKLWWTVPIYAFFPIATAYLALRSKKGGTRSTPAGSEVTSAD